MTDKLIHAEISIKELEAMAKSINSLHSSGKINSEQKRLLMHSIMAGDSKGNLWTIGTQTGKWYKQVGGKWLAGEPPEKLLLVIPEADYKKAAMKLEELKFELDTKLFRANHCAKCGAEFKVSEFFCPKCGAALAKQQAPSPPVKTDKCPGCGQALTGNPNFCTNCGRKINK